MSSKKNGVDGEAPKLETVKLIQPHEHGEVVYPVGAEIQVLPYEKELLIAWKKIDGKSDSGTQE